MDTLLINRVLFLLTHRKVTINQQPQIGTGTTKERGNLNFVVKPDKGKWSLSRPFIYFSDTARLTSPRWETARAPIPN